ncbi:MAG: SDR family NAD(P)-dependent oxidoreductase, partial [Phycisphaerales bacterium]
MGLEHRIAIVTGAAGYIGSTTAKRLASDGATVVICDVNPDLARTVADGITAAGGKALAVAADVRSTASVESLVAQVIEQYGRLDILVNVAGGSARERASTVHGSSEEVIR